MKKQSQIQIHQKAIQKKEKFTQIKINNQGEIQWYCKRRKKYIHQFTFGFTTFTQNQECTTQNLFISYGNLLTINDIPFNSLDKATQHLIKLQKSESKQKISITVPSLFHEELPVGLREKIIFIDTYNIKDIIRPGIKQNDCQTTMTESVKSDKDHFVNLMIADYSQISNQQKQLQEQLKENQANKSEQQLCFLNDLILILNKCDMRNKSEDDSVEQIEKKIQAEIFLISAKDALQYRIMKSDNQMAQNEFIRKYMIDNSEKKECKNFEACQIFCKERFNDPNLINNQNQQYYELIKRRKQKRVLTENMNKFLLVTNFLRYFTRLDTMDQFEERFDNYYMKILEEYKVEIRKLEDFYLSKIQQIFATQKSKLKGEQIENKKSEEIYKAVTEFALKKQRELKDEINALNKKTGEKFKIFMNECQNIAENKKKKIHEIQEKILEKYVGRKAHWQALECIWSLFFKIDDICGYGICWAFKGLLKYVLEGWLFSAIPGLFHIWVAFSIIPIAFYSAVALGIYAFWTSSLVLSVVACAKVLQHLIEIEKKCEEEIKLQCKQAYETQENALTVLLYALQDEM